jgi:hypothetical protein
MCETFASVTLFKINDLAVRNFLLKYIHADPPSKSTFKKNCRPKCYAETLKNIWILCGKENIWESIYEPIDASGRRFQILLLGFEKRSNAIREIISSLMPGNVYNE